MMLDQSNVEESITRLAQMSRAVGIHLILATASGRRVERSSSGLIKANFPARISFRVATKIDSRTILDANGANRCSPRRHAVLAFRLRAASFVVHAAVGHGKRDRCCRRILAARKAGAVRREIPASSERRERPAPKAEPPEAMTMKSTTRCSKRRRPPGAPSSARLQRRSSSAAYASAMAAPLTSSTHGARRESSPSRRP